MKKGYIGTLTAPIAERPPPEAGERLVNCLSCGKEDMYSATAVLLAEGVE
jgi:hypothetical protein